MVNVKDVSGGLWCVVAGVKDSILGIWPVLQLIRQNEKVRNLMLQCCLLNGVILWLSVLLFDYALLPAIQILASLVYSFISDPGESGFLPWLGIVVWYVFTGLWVLPVFWISKPINSIWFQDIASAAFEGSKQKQVNKAKKTKTKSKSEGGSLSQTISRFIADLLFSVVVELLFLVQAMVVGLIPGLGYYLSILHLAVLYSLYAFEYKWMYLGWIVHQRVEFVEKNWPYFIGFGLPLAIITSLPSSTVISACIFAVVFPFLIVSANEAKPVQSLLSKVPLFKIVVLICNKLFSRSNPTNTNINRTAPSHALHNGGVASASGFS